MFRSGKLILIAGVSVILFFCAFCGYKVYALSSERREVKRDYSVINNVSFGLLSVDHWRDQVVAAVSNKIQNFELTKDEENNLRKEIEQILHSLITKAVSEVNKPAKTIGGKLKKAVFKTFVDTTQLHSEVPVFAQQIIAQIEKPSNKEKLKNLAEDKLQDLGGQTTDSTTDAENAVRDSIYKKYNVPDDSTFQAKATFLLHSTRHDTYSYSFGMLASVVLILLLWFLLRKKPELHTALFMMSVISALILLLVGLTTTMIELDARIKSMDFKIIGADISFKNQVLFYQSKSILDVVRILINTGKADMIVVGSLVFCFSVVFPFAKLTSASIYLLKKKKPGPKNVLYFFAFNSGKWSMADVMVVAMMMTYIGFNGVVQSQLADLNIHSETITSITTNNTSLQAGYIVFVGFVVYGLILSQILKHITKPDREAVPAS